MHMKDSKGNLSYSFKNKCLTNNHDTVSLPSYIDPQTLPLPLGDTASPANKAALQRILVTCEVNTMYNSKLSAC